MFQDPDRQQFYDLWSNDHHTSREEARQHVSPTWKQFQNNHARADCSEGGDIFLDERSWSDYPLSGLRASDREELIRYIKSTEASPWVPQSSVCISMSPCQYSASSCFSGASGCFSRIHSSKSFYSSGNRVPATLSLTNPNTWRISPLNAAHRTRDPVQMMRS